MAREYPIKLTYEEILAVQGALESLDAEYGISSSFYKPHTLPSGALVEEHRAEARRASDEAFVKGETLLAKFTATATVAAELEPVDHA